MDLLGMKKLLLYTLGLLIASGSTSAEAQNLIRFCDYGDQG